MFSFFIPNMVCNSKCPLDTINADIAKMGNRESISRYYQSFVNILWDTKGFSPFERLMFAEVVAKQCQLRIIKVQPSGERIGNQFYNFILKCYGL